MSLSRRLVRRRRHWLLRYLVDVEDDVGIIWAQLFVTSTSKFNKDCTYRILVSLVNMCFLQTSLGFNDPNIDLAPTLGKGWQWSSVMSAQRDVHYWSHSQRTSCCEYGGPQTCPSPSYHSSHLPVSLLPRIGSA